jgi:hypothetical protein
LGNAAKLSVGMNRRCQEANDVSGAVCARSEAHLAGYGYLTDQLNCAALSSAANIAEGNGCFTKPEAFSRTPR